jgi:rRNA maturation RNase YbeY
MDFDKYFDFSKVSRMVVLGEGLVLGDISVNYFTDDELLEVNRDFLKHDYYTDIITFDEVVGRVVNGELLISTERVQENANVNSTNFGTELLRVLIHGVLHLCGYGDKSSEEAKLMREKEDFYINEYNVSRETLK